MINIQSNEHRNTIEPHKSIDIHETKDITSYKIIKVF